MERASTLGARRGLSVGCEDEAGPFQAVPHPGASWQPRDHPAQHPHDYIRGGTTKILTLFHPATGQVRLQPAARGTNGVLHPWLRERLSAILAALPVPKASLDPQGSRINPVYPYEMLMGSPEVSSFAKLSRLREPQSLRNQPQA